MLNQTTAFRASTPGMADSNLNYGAPFGGGCCNQRGPKLRRYGSWMFRTGAVWWRIRELRSAPPGQAGQDGQDDRVATFRSALEQAEQLFDAASQVPLSTSPLLAFYGLSQAGRAITAAWSDDSDWIPPSSHGISSTRGTNFAAVTVTSKRKGHFNTVSDALSSASFGKATLPELIGALPGVDAGFQFSGDVLRPLQVVSLGHSGGLLIPGLGPIRSWLCGLPESLLQADDRVQSITAFLGRYPTLAGWRFVPGFEPTPVQRVADGWATQLEWPTEGAWLNSGLDRAAMTPPPGCDDMWVPTVIGEGVLAPIMIWWTVLLALSTLVRYEPAGWALMTNVDESPVAVSLDRLMQCALDDVPRHILQALCDPLEWKPARSEQG